MVCCGKIGFDTKSIIQRNKTETDAAKKPTRARDKDLWTSEQHRLGYIILLRASR